MNKPATTDKLALLGGPKTITSSFKRYNPIGEEEAKAVEQVIKSGVLSQFLGVWHPDFFGGPRVQEFERQCEAYFGAKHAVTVNSWTSGLIAAVAAVGIEPGDEVIVTPWTMSASASAILHCNAIPVFADIEAETFCLDPVSVEKNISPYTKAIMAVDIMGHPADMEALREIADRHGLMVISDTAQAPGAIYKDRPAGAYSHVWGHSLNYHKHIHTGEGGILFTDDDEIADRLRLIRNHAEAVVGNKGVTNLANMVGYNFRLGEIECAIGIEQLKKLEKLVAEKQRIANLLTEGLSDLRGLRPPVVKPGCTHAYYMYPLVLDIDLIGIPRGRIIEALEAEGVAGLVAGYINVHLLPMYQKKIAFGSSGFPWTSDICKRQVSYDKGICPVAEELQDSTYVGFHTCIHEFNDRDIELIVQAFQKVWGQLELLK